MKTSLWLKESDNISNDVEDELKKSIISKIPEYSQSIDIEKKLKEMNEKKSRDHRLDLMQSHNVFKSGHVLRKSKKEVNISYHMNSEAIILPVPTENTNKRH